MVLPTATEKRLKLGPNSEESRSPDTALMANDTAKNLDPDTRKRAEALISAQVEANQQGGDEGRAEWSRPGQ